MTAIATPQVIAPPGTSPTATATATAGVASPIWRWRRPRRSLLVAAVMVAWVVAGTLLRGRHTLFLEVADETAVHRWFTSGRDWFDSHRYSSELFSGLLDGIRSAVEALTTLLQGLLSQPSLGRPVPVIGWLGVVALAAYLAYAVGNARVSLLTAGVLVGIGGLGLWQPAMETLAQILAAVAICVILGIPLGVYIGVSRRAERIVMPVLDTMQAMPAMVYLAPLALLFLIGPPAAVIVTVIYALPPLIRLTAHGVRQVDSSALEAGRALGATGWQQLRTVRLPLARRTIVVGVNQATMAALSMLMIAVLIGAPGLGQEILRNLLTQDVGSAFLGGLAVVLLGIMLDRVTTAAGQRAEKAHSAGRTRRRLLAGGGVATLVAVYLSHSYYWASLFPGSGGSGAGIGGAIGDAVNAANDWVRLNLHPLTDAVKDAVSYGLLNPLQTIIAESPWYVVCAAVLALAWTLAGARSLLLTTACLGLLLASGLWQDSMVTLTSVLAATILVLVLGVVFGVLLARSRRADLLLRPVLDAAQALPAFIYLIPFVGLFGPTRFTAIMAGVVFAAPAAIKIVADGIAGVPSSTVEAAVASGSSRWQVITKVQLPLARQAIALAANQGLLFVLSVVVVGGLVGAGALGFLNVYGFSQTKAWGKGFVAGIAIVVLAVLLDRLARAAVRRAGREHRPTS